jgi:hypothetical protein
MVICLILWPLKALEVLKSTFNFDLDLTGLNEEIAKAKRW